MRRLYNISKSLARWTIRFEFVNRITAVPLRFIQIAMQFVILCAVLKITIKDSLMVGLIGIGVFIVISWIIDRTQFRQKVEGEAGDRHGSFIKMFNQLDRIENKL